MMGIKVFLIDFSQLILPLMYQTFKWIITNNYYYLKINFC